MELNAGKTIGQAVEIIKKTYLELERMRDDIVTLVKERIPTMTYVEEYSYGGKYLSLRHNHTYLFRSNSETILNGEKYPEEQQILAITCIFCDEGKLKRINLKDEPELWAGLIDISNATYAIRPWDIYDLLTLDERQNFVGQLIIGKVCKYHWIDEKTKEEWTGEFIGNALCDITDRDKIQKNIVDLICKKNN